MAVHVEETVGDFLRAKMMNMARWVQKELQCEFDLPDFISNRSTTELTFIAGTLAAEKPLIVHKDWHGLSQLGDMPDEMLEVFHSVRQRPPMHDKFWRYLELFAAVVS